MTLYDRIKKHEGLRLKPYRCPAGKLSIGYGRNLEDNGITEEEANAMLQLDVIRSFKECDSAFYWFKNLDTARQEVLVEMCFNMGLKRLKSFKKMLAACEIKDFNTAAAEMLDSLWARQVGERADNLAAIMKG